MYDKCRMAKFTGNQVYVAKSMMPSCLVVRAISKIHAQNIETAGCLIEPIGATLNQHWPAAWDWAATGLPIGDLAAVGERGPAVAGRRNFDDRLRRSIDPAVRPRYISAVRPPLAAGKGRRNPFWLPSRIALLADRQADSSSEIWSGEIWRWLARYPNAHDVPNLEDKARWPIQSRPRKWCARSHVRRL